ncbi:MAG: hypothetical protein JXR78_07775 [Victivallales bacterium]|nr:hypothetical protein [Victivallales bacterium]
MNFNVYKKLLLCFSAVLFIVRIDASETSAPKVSEEDVVNAVKMAEEKNMNLLISSEQKIEQAKAAENKHNFEEAVKLTEEARNILKELQGSYAAYRLRGVDEYMTLLKINWGAAEMSRARKAYLDGKYTEAASAARSAMRIDDRLSSQVEEFVARCEKKITHANLEKGSNIETLVPDLQRVNDEIAILLREVDVYMKHKMYEKAQENLERILLRDPFNREASRRLNKLFTELQQIGDKRRRSDYMDGIQALEWAWMEQLPARGTIPVEDKPTVRAIEESGLHEKLQKIIFNNLEFDGASITSVITHLNNLSKEADPDRVGVSIVSNLSNTEARGVGRISLSFDHIPMAEAIRYICLQANLKYKIEENAVIIGGSSIDEMDIRFFNVRYALISSIFTDAGGSAEEDLVGGEVVSLEDAFSAAVAGNKATGNKTAGGGGAGAAGTGTATAGGGSSSLLAQSFSERGIPFDEGATIAYDRRAGKLIVKNTYENLRKLEHLLRDLDIQTPLVLIEAKIVEMRQSDLEELGFDWVFSSVGDATTHPHWSIGENSTLLRHYSASDSNSTGARNYKLLNDLKILPNFGGEDFNLNLSLTINAIDQHSKNEILSAPKVIATSGTTAIIRMVEQMYFPESWSDPELNVSSGTIDLTPPEPDFGDAIDVGVRFQVTPTVSPNNYTISLHMIPQVISFSGWTEYPVYMEAGNVTINNIAIKMPIITKRDLNTNVKVFDGETIVLGGMLTDETIERNDKWPILGDIPLIGRLFSSQMSKTEKVNLLIFVTARLINNDGVPVREGSLRGVHDFNR